VMSSSGRRPSPDVLAERVIQRYLQATREPGKVIRPERVEPVIMPTYEAVYGVPIYIIGEGYAGQVRRFFYMRGAGGRKWIFEVSPCIIIYGRKGEIALPVVVMGLPTMYASREFDYYVVEEVRPFRSVECEERDIVNLERVMRAEDPVLVIDKYGLYRRAVPQDYWMKYVELQNMVANLQQTVYDLEHERSELITNLRMRETESAVLREELENLRAQVVKLRSEVTNYYLEYLRLKNEARMQSKIADMLEDMFYRLEARLREFERVAGGKEGVGGEREEGGGSRPKRFWARR